MVGTEEKGIEREVTATEERVVMIGAEVVEEEGEGEVVVRKAPGHGAIMTRIIGTATIMVTEGTGMTDMLAGEEGRIEALTLKAQSTRTRSQGLHGLSKHQIIQRMHLQIQEVRAEAVHLSPP